MSKHNFKSIAMLSTHGYFDPIPQLGRTDTGGQVVYVIEMAKAMAKQGIKVDIYTRWFEKRKPQVDPMPGFPDVRVIRIPAGKWEFVPKEFIYDLLPELTSNMIDFIKSNKLDYDLFHGHYVDAGIVTLDVAKVFGKPTFFTAHSLGAWKQDQMGGNAEEMERKFNFKHRNAEELRIFKEVHGQTLTSTVQHEKLVELYNFDAPNIAIIPPGVDVDRFKIPTVADLKAPSPLPHRYIYCLSRIDSNKGHDLLLRAFSLVKDVVEDVTLVIGGGSPNPKPREKEVFAMMDRIIVEENMENRVMFAGYVPDEKMVTFYQQAEMFVLPSIFEPFGMTSQESMACGVPVVASKFGGIRNIMIHGKNGMLVDPSNPKEFAEAMIKILQDSELRMHIGMAGSDTIRGEFSWIAIANKFLDFYSRFI